MLCRTASFCQLTRVLLPSFSSSVILKICCLAICCEKIMYRNSPNAGTMKSTIIQAITAEGDFESSKKISPSAISALRT